MTSQEEWEMFDPDWGEPEKNSKMNYFEKYWRYQSNDKSHSNCNTFRFKDSRPI